MEENFKYCADLVRKAHHDRYLAALFAPAGRREALFALYAFDIEMSRIRDLSREPMPGEIRLQWWREVLESKRGGEAAANPVAAALLTILAQHGLGTDKLAALVEAHRFDVYNEPMPTFAALQAYASDTAGTVFDYAVRVLGGTPSASAAAVEAGQAQGFANLMSLLPRHAARRQLFLPLDMLAQYHADPEDVFNMRATSGLRAVLAELRLLARRHLAHIADMSDDIPETVWPAFLSLAPLQPWLAAMERSEYEPFQPSELARWRRQWRIWRSAKSLTRISR